MKRSTTAKTFAIAAVAALALGCGTYGEGRQQQRMLYRHPQGHLRTNGTGFVIAPPTIAGPVAGVGTYTFDGNGNIYAAGYQPERQHVRVDWNGHIQSESRLHRHLHEREFDR